MNLHLVADSNFINVFYNNLEELDLLESNKIVGIKDRKNVRRLRPEIQCASLYSNEFKTLIGDVGQYDKVFIHLFSPLMYRWIARHSFVELNWMVWGTDLYDSPIVKYNVYEKLTWYRYVRVNYSREILLYKLKVFLTNSIFKKIAYSKVTNVLTWMESEYSFAVQNIKSLKAKHQYFFYENASPYKKLDDYLKISPKQDKADKKPIIILGNSGTPTNNHLDAIQYISDIKLSAHLIIPVSYGDTRYINFLKKSVSFYTLGTIEFMDTFLSFDEYVKFLLSADALVMNNIRPQGYGNIFMMMYLNKPVFLNKENISTQDLTNNNILWHTFEDLKSLKAISPTQNNEALLKLFSHQELQKVYSHLF